jgi:predicted transcriptional regulator
MAKLLRRRKDEVPVGKEVEEVKSDNLPVPKQETSLKKITDGDIACELKESKGFVSKAADKLGITTSAVYARINKSDILKEIKMEIDESLLDHAELKLSEAVNDCKPWAVCFYLKCKGKRRGYTESSKEDVDTPEEKAYKVKQVLDSLMDITKPQLT